MPAIPGYGQQGPEYDSQTEEEKRRQQQQQAAPTTPPATPQYDAATIGAHAMRGLSLGDATNTYNRDAVAEAFKQKQFSGDSNINAADYLKSLGGIATGITMVSPDKIRLPDGEIVDVTQNVSAGGTGGAWWGSEKDWTPGAGAGSGGGGGNPGAGGAGPGLGGGGGLGPSTFDRTRSDALYQELLNRSKQGLNINAQTDANIRQQADPYEAAMIRAERERMADVAEQRGPLANLEGERRLGAEKVGQASGAFEASLIGQEIQARRQEIADALQSRGTILSQDQQEALQRELANLDAQLKRYSIDQSTGLGYAGIAQQDRGLQGQDRRFGAELAQREWERWNDENQRREGL